MASWHTVGSKNVSVVVWPKQVVKSWSVKPDKQEVVEGGTLTIIATVNWQAPKDVKFKIAVEAFGKRYESKEVSAKVGQSPIEIRMSIQVPTGIIGSKTMKVILYAYY